MRRRYWLLCGACLLVGSVGAGCTPSAPSKLTPEQLQKQREEDKADLKAEDQKEAELQKKQRSR